MQRNTETDLQQTQAANRKKTVEREHFPRWNKMVQAEKERQAREGKPKRSITSTKKGG